MTVTVRLPALLRDFSDGAAWVEVDGTTVSEVLAALERAHPAIAGHLCDERGRLLGHLVVFVDGHDVRRRAGLATEVADGGEVTIQHAMSGG